MLGHDHAPFPITAYASARGVSVSDEPTRYLFVTNTAVPALIEDGVAPEAIDVMMRDVPQRFLSGDTADLP
jgi:predicted metal-dependent phosphotriesterase family hydrolase